ncbi:MAG: PHP domain-containing protein [Candidatus Omnitrophica bacterium]|nr:PHP domain-containing protein [Candidatus Omnitrophota bacterium]MDD5026872.1 PHP domain-containing protein [Candidatus Omnitrophota bacterium]MDD5661987.1 PHP domain-containing protein [Candidatus Omnitrophota bacterium]
MKFADLHLHTVFSDGTYTPEELISQSLKSGLSAIAVVDHDTVAGLAPTIAAAGESGLEVLSGVEISAEYKNQEVHILGYLVDHQDKAFLEKTVSLKNNRIERVYKMVAKLNALGLPLDPQSVFDLAGSGTVGRLHIARALVKGGLVRSIYEVFQKYIGDNGPAYVLGFRFTPQEAIAFIKQAGGVPVLAHPYALNNDELILEFVKLGLMGLEVYYPEHSQGAVNFYLELARQNNLLVTGGSDCHGKAKPEVRIGSIKVPYALVEKLKEAKENLR